MNTPPTNLSFFGHANDSGATRLAASTLSLRSMPTAGLVIGAAILIVCALVVRAAVSAVVESIRFLFRLVVFTVSIVLIAVLLSYEVHAASARTAPAQPSVTQSSPPVAQSIR